MNGGQEQSSNIGHRTHSFSLRIISFVSKLPKDKLYWVISDQLMRSGTSIGANVREAKCSRSRAEFARYYEIALKSANETCYWLDLIRD